MPSAPSASVKSTVPQAARRLDKNIIMLYDPTPGLTSSVDLEQLKATMDPEIRFQLFDDHSRKVHLIEFPVGKISDGSGQDSVKAVLEAGGFSNILFSRDDSAQ